MNEQKRPRTKVIHRRWEIQYSTEGEEFVFDFCSDGTGHCRDAVSETDVPFKWNAAEVAQLNGGDTEIALHNVASDVFWSEINDQLGDDAVITDEYLSEHPEETDVEFTCGSREELNRLTRLILHSFPSIWSDGSERRTVSFTAEGDSSGESAGIEDDQYSLKLGSGLPKDDRLRVVELLNIAIGQNTPVGEYLAYNDGAYHRKSGYSWCVKREVVNVDRPSFHEMAEARGQLREDLKVFLSTADLDRVIPIN